MPKAAPDPFIRNAVVLSVLDGDTVMLDVDLGYFDHIHVPHRLFGINAPENASASGKASTAYLRDLLPVGTKVVIKSTKPKQDGIASDKYGGRFLAHVYRESDNLYVNEHLVTEGFAKSWDGKGVKPT